MVFFVEIFVVQSGSSTLLGDFRFAGMLVSINSGRPYSFVPNIVYFLPLHSRRKTSILAN
jgi:hypothetical protein